MSRIAPALEGDEGHSDLEEGEIRGGEENKGEGGEEGTENRSDAVSRRQHRASPSAAGGADASEQIAAASWGVPSSWTGSPVPRSSAAETPLERALPLDGAAEVPENKSGSRERAGKRQKRKAMRQAVRSVNWPVSGR